MIYCDGRFHLLSTGLQGYALCIDHVGLIDPSPLPPHFARFSWTAGGVLAHTFRNVSVSFSVGGVETA